MINVAGILKKTLLKHSSGSIILLIFVSAGILFFVFFVSYKNILFEKALNSVSAKFASLGYQFSWKGSRVIHFNRISIHEIKLTSETDSTKVKIDSLSMKFGFLSALSGRIKIKNLSCRNIEALYANHIILAAKDTNTVKEQHPATASFGYATMLNRIVRRLFLAIPRKLDIDIIRIIVRGAENDMLFSFHNSKINEGNLRSTFYTGGVADSMEVLLEGRISRKRPFTQLLAHSPGNNNCTLNFPGKYPVRAGFDTLMLSFSFPHYSNKLVTIEGTSFSKDFVLEGERLSANPITIGRILSSFTLHVKPMSFELDSSSTVTINDISLHPFISIQKDPDLTADFKICPVAWDAGDFFRSLPEGMFTSLTGFSATGNLKFFLDFSLDMALVDSLHFSSKLSADEFRILKYGNDDYRILNTEFTHQFYDRGTLAASFPVGLTNPDFTPLAAISPWLKTSVLTSEDGNFYYHKGFNPGAIRESIITNIKQRKFVRGGSTISMQLVKNVFLTRNKTIGRKLEELLIVWIMENNRLVSKERMFEIYLNIIEWGPGIYGITQASRYYFHKSPAELNLQESLFLAGIVPFPKRFKSVFEYNGSPKAYFAGYMQRMKELMVARSYIQSIDTLGVGQNVFLTGPASQVFVIPDTVNTDTLLPEDIYVLPLEVVSPE
jgi:hypothetical protein